MNTNGTVLIVDDDERFLNSLRNSVGRRYDCRYFPSSQDALEFSSSAQNLNLLILDYSLPGLSGLDFLDGFRRHHARTPVIVVSGMADFEMAKGFLKRRIFSFLEKPILLDDLEQNMEEALGLAKLMSASEPQQIRRFGDFEVDTVRRQVRAEGKLISLTPIEFELISLLTGSPGEVLSRETIHSKVWGHVSLSKNVLDTHLMNLRKKVPGFAERLTSVYGVGFSFS